MLTILNGQLIDEADAKVSIFDRAFLYGDGLFETVRVSQGRPFRWEDHMARLHAGAEFIRIAVPFSDTELHDQARMLIEGNQTTEALLRLTLSRGVGVRGYSPRGADHPVLAMTLHPAPELNQTPPSWRAVTASFRLPAGEMLAHFKTCNKLPQILARAEAETRGADEALMLNTSGEIVEASAGNLFFVREGVVCTPPLSAGILAGVTRAVIMEICARLGIPTRETAVNPDELPLSDGVFETLSSWGIVEVVSFDGRELRQSPLVKRLRESYLQMLRAC